MNTPFSLKVLQEAYKLPEDFDKNTKIFIKYIKASDKVCQNQFTPKTFMKKIPMVMKKGNEETSSSI